MAFFSPWKLSSQKLGFFLVTFGFIWGMMLLHFTIQQRTQPESSSMLREQILDLSKRYIKALAEENRDVVDGPYAGVMTAYDLKKTLAVLLDNILQRIGKLESKVDNLVNGTGANSTNSTTAVPSLVSLEKINVADIINGVQEKCVLPPMDGYPHCEGKIKWMKDMWRSDPCYADYGVDGTSCSFFIYLSEVENWCPRLPWRAKNPYEEADHNSLAEIRTDFNILYGMMKKHEEFRWMRLRIRRMADAWIQAIKSLAEKQNLEKRKRKKILVHLGLLTKESGFKIAETAFSGGPLGELVQWSDLITSLICEPSFFQHLNKEKDLLKYKVTCQSSELYKDILVPSFYPKSKHCVFQGDLLLFSCAGAHPTHQRICPCRDFINGQVALCKDCL